MRFVVNTDGEKSVKSRLPVSLSASRARHGVTPRRDASRARRRRGRRRSRAARRRSSARRRPAACAAHRPAAGCSSSSARCRCAGTSRTRSGRRSRTRSSQLVEHRRRTARAARPRAARTAARAAGSPRRARRGRRARGAPPGSSSGCSVSLTVQELARAGHELRADDLRREPAEAEPGAVRAGRGRARDRLPVDVAHVRHARGRRARAGAGSWCRRVPAASVTRPVATSASITPERSVEVELHAGRHRDAGEAVAGADGLDAQPGCRGGDDGALHRARPSAGPLDPHAVAPPRCGPSCATVCSGRASQEGLSFAAVGGHRVDDLAAVDDGELVQVLGELARLRVAEPDAVADPQVARGRAASPGSAPRPPISRGSIARPSGQTIRGSRSAAGRPGCDPAAAEDRRVSRGSASARRRARTRPPGAGVKCA